MKASRSMSPFPKSGESPPPMNALRSTSPSAGAESSINELKSTSPSGVESAFGAESSDMKESRSISPSSKDGAASSGSVSGCAPDTSDSSGVKDIGLFSS